VLQNDQLARIEESFPCLKTEKSASKLEADLNLPLIRGRFQKSASKLEADLNLPFNWRQVSKICLQFRGRCDICL
jgi:hypothetical protein